MSHEAAAGSGSGSALGKEDEEVDGEEGETIRGGGRAHGA